MTNIMSKRLIILKASLNKKCAKFDAALSAHSDSVKAANGQPLNDKRNGVATLKKWEAQNEALRKLDGSIKITRAAIERETIKQAYVESFAIPPSIRKLIESGVLVQWRKHPLFFFVAGVEKARILIQKNGQIAARYVRDIPSKEQYAVFRDVFNGLRRDLL